MSTVLVVVAAALLIVGVVTVVVRRSAAPRRALTRDLDDRLAAALGPGTGSHLDRAPTVRRLAVEEEGEGTLLVPIVRIDFDTTDAPGMELVFEYVADAIEAMQPAFETHDERVSHYEIECTFGPDGLIVAGECRRVSVPVEFADRLVGDNSYRAFDLRQDVKRGDGREGAVSTLWDECRS